MIALRKNKAAADPDCRYIPPFTTLHCGTITGGQAHNITAQSCEFVTDIRLLPEEDLDTWINRYRDFAQTTVLPKMLEISEDCRIDIEVLAKVPGLAEESDGLAEQTVRQITGDNGRHVVVYATEGGIFQEHGFSTVVCGPGSIDQAHQPDEYIELAELDRCADFFGQT